MTNQTIIKEIQFSEYLSLIVCIQGRQLLKPKKLKHLGTIYEPKREAAYLHCIKNDGCGSKR